VIQPSLERRRVPVAHRITWNLKRGIGRGCEATGRRARQCVASATNQFIGRFVESVITTEGIRKHLNRLFDHLFELPSGVQNTRTGTTGRSVSVAS